MKNSTSLALAAAFVAAGSLSAYGQVSDPTCASADWLTKSDEAFAADCANIAFTGGLEDREVLAWMFFVRLNQLIDDPTNGGMSGSGKVPVWMAYPTDPDTFDSTTPFAFNEVPRVDMKPSSEKSDILAGQVATADPDGANEEVTRNKISYDYLTSSGLTTKAGVATFFESNEYVNMPVGSVELKASWLQVTNGSPAPDGALTFKFESGEYWWRGIHIMVKMQNLSDPSDVFYTEDPSWFWSTFEFNDNPGVAHVRDTLITQRAPLGAAEIEEILAAGDMAGFGLENYAPNGTQIRFTVDGDGTTPIILGHTDMEDFAGTPNTAQPQYWTAFEASCHACHATASYNPATSAFFPFSVPTGALHPGYNIADGKGITQYLGQGYKSLDFMWPISFQTK